MRWLLVCCLMIAGAVSQAGASRPAEAARAPLDGPALSADITRAISVNGKARSFIYAVSAAPAPAAGRPLVIHLHGDGGRMGLSAAWKGAVLSDAGGAVLLSADGRNNIVPPLIDNSAWRFRMDEAGQPYDDIDFIGQLIDEAIAGTALPGVAIDPEQIYLVGESRGAGFAYFLYADPRTRDKVRAIVPISGTFYCDGDATNSGTIGTPPVPGSDTACGEVSQFGYWGPRPSLFTGATRTPHILDVHGQLSADGGNELSETAPPALDMDYMSSQWEGWASAAGCYSVRVSSQTEQDLPYTVGGRAVKTYAYSQAENDLATRCAGLDLTFYIAQGGGHVPGGFERAAWCFLSTVGGAPSASACPASALPRQNPAYLPLVVR